MACDVLAFTIIPWIALTHSTNACITLSAWVMEEIGDAIVLEFHHVRY
jgi:hypothetical protein